MFSLETKRLTLRRLTPADAPFMLRLLNDPAFHRFIGDRGVRTVAEAEMYIAEGPAVSYARNGFGLYLTERKTDDQPLGICGLVKREGLADVDIGYAFLPAYWGQGYALEAATAVKHHARTDCHLSRLVAITSLDNDSSIKLLEKLGFVFEQLIRFSEDGDQVKLFAYEWDS